MQELAHPKFADMEETHVRHGQTLRLSARGLRHPAAKSKCGYLIQAERADGLARGIDRAAFVKEVVIE
jgi:hypothetical protein